MEWGLGTGKGEGQSWVAWTLEGRVGNRFEEGLTGRFGLDSPDWGTSFLNPDYMALDPSSWGRNPQPKFDP